MVFCPLIASIATRALNSAVNCRRFLVVIVSPCLEAMILHLKYLSEFWGAAQIWPFSLGDKLIDAGFLVASVGSQSEAILY